MRKRGVVWAFHEDWDLLQVLWRPQPAAGVPSLIFKHSVERGGSSGEDLGRFLWIEVDRKAYVVSLSRIDFFFNEGILVGLSFGYPGTAMQRSMGICEGIRSSLFLRQHEKVLAIDMDCPSRVTTAGGAFVVVSSLPVVLPSCLAGQKWKLMPFEKVHTDQRQNLAIHGSDGSPFPGNSTRGQQRTLKRCWFLATLGGPKIKTTLPYKLDSKEAYVPKKFCKSLGIWARYLKIPRGAYYICQLGAIFPSQ